MSKEDNYKMDDNYEELKNGPVDNRECRDILCCLLFIAASITLGALFIYGVSTGKPSQLMTPFDSNSVVFLFYYSVDNVVLIQMLLIFHIYIFLLLFLIVSIDQFACLHVHLITV